MATNVPRVNSADLKFIAPSWECMDKQLVRDVKASMLRGTLGETSDKTRGSLRALALLRARLPEHIVEQHLVWREDDTYENICRRRLDALNGLYPEW